MSEHAPLTEAEPKYAVQGEWLVEYVNEHTCGTGPHGYYGAHEPGCGMEPVARIADILDALAARTSTATAEDCGERFRVMARNAPPYICDKPKGHDGGHGTGYAKSTATADTGLRERVEAALASYSSGQCGAIRALTDIEAALDATAAPTTDTGARDE